MYIFKHNIFHQCLEDSCSVGQLELWRLCFEILSCFWKTWHGIYTCQGRLHHCSGIKLESISSPVLRGNICAVRSTFLTRWHPIPTCSAQRTFTFHIVCCILETTPFPSPAYGTPCFSAPVTIMHKWVRKAHLVSLECRYLAHLYQYYLVGLVPSDCSLSFRGDNDTCIWWYSLEYAVGSPWLPDTLTQHRAW